MEHQETLAEFETRYQWLRPAQLVERRNACPLIFVPVGPLEYHGPHLPLGTDAINCTRVAHACCRKLRKGVVLPTLMMGTERERCPAQVESFGFEPGTRIVGMDFPGRLWDSHYLPEEVFAIHLAAELRILIGQGYRYICIANGHGAVNHMEVINRLCVELSNTSPAKLVWRLTLPQEVLDGRAGHADSVETSLMMHYNRHSVDLGTLPGRDVPIRTWEFSIVDGPGFTPQYHRDHVVRDDPRNSTVEQGKRSFNLCVDELAADVERLIG
ncbi:MAG: creatininase family protein [Planctomycetia bacterium]|nr:creatininase family protein [Planctomycetia bacterium]